MTIRVKNIINKLINRYKTTHNVQLKEHEVERVLMLDDLFQPNDELKKGFAHYFRVVNGLTNDNVHRDIYK